MSISIHLNLNSTSDLTNYGASKPTPFNVNRLAGLMKRLSFLFQSNTKQSNIILDSQIEVNEVKGKFAVQKGEIVDPSAKPNTSSKPDHSAKAIVVSEKDLLHLVKKIIKTKLAFIVEKFV